MAYLNTVVKCLDVSRHHDALRYEKLASDTCAVKIALDAAHSGSSRRNLFAWTVFHDAMAGARRGAWAGSAVRMVGGEGLGSALLPLARTSTLISDPSDPLIVSTLQRYQGRPAGLINYISTGAAVVGVAVGTAAVAKAGFVGGALLGAIVLSTAGLLFGGVLGSRSGVRGIALMLADKIGPSRVSTMLCNYAASPRLDRPQKIGFLAGALGGLAMGTAVGIVGGALVGLVLGLAVGFAAASIAAVLACGTLAYVGGAVSLVGQAMCCAAGGIIGAAYGTVAGAANVLKHNPNVGPQREPLLSRAASSSSSSAFECPLVGSPSAG